MILKEKITTVQIIDSKSDIIYIKLKLRYFLMKPEKFQFHCVQASKIF